MRRFAVLVLLSLSAALLAVGLSRGEFDDVFTKGAYLCLECIGLGR